LEIVHLFRELPLLRVISDEEDPIDSFTKVHCASDGLCHLRTTTRLPALIDRHFCPGCGKAVHSTCGYTHPDLIKTERLTCYLCFDKFGRAISGKDDPLYMSERKTTEADVEPLNLTDFPPTEGAPADNTRLRRPTGFVSPSKKTALFEPKAPSTRQLELWTEMDSAINSKNPKYMYPEASADEDDDGEWWLDANGKMIPAIAPAEDHLPRHQSNHISFHQTR
jgi:hypothetical protein